MAASMHGTRNSVTTCMLYTVESELATNNSIWIQILCEINVHGLIAAHLPTYKMEIVLAVASTINRG